MIFVSIIVSMEIIEALVSEEQHTGPKSPELMVLTPK